VNKKIEKMANKEKKLDLSDFECFEKLTESAQRTFTLYPEIPIISIKKGGIGFGKTAIDFLQLTKNSSIMLLKREQVNYLAVLPFDSKFSGYAVQLAGLNNMHCSFKAEKRGFEHGYFKLKEPIFVSGLDLYEMQPFNIDEKLSKNK
jgi:hypothetical protein